MVAISFSQFFLVFSQLKMDRPELRLSVRRSPKIMHVADDILDI
jgi:hypothetical protein